MGSRFHAKQEVGPHALGGEMMNGMMEGGLWHMGAAPWLATVVWAVILVGLAVLVWLWVIKLYRQLFGKKN